MAGAPFKPALILVDLQNDFCPPDGSLAVEGARSISSLANELLSYPGWALRVATQDWHPADHVSFASNHPSPNNQPFTSYVDVRNPHEESRTKQIRLWPVHCVQNSQGAEIIREIDQRFIDLYVKKGMDSRIEMYSAFEDAFRNLDSVKKGAVDVDLADFLHQRGVTDVYSLGVAGDYCVKDTALGAAHAGFRSFVVEEGVKCVDPGQGWESAKDAFGRAGVEVVSMVGPEIKIVKDLGTT